jgi:cold shock CspA family protein
VIVGTVESFDEPRGLGTLLAEDGRRYLFHCLEIADGSRTIAVGTAVRARRVVGHLGQDEAASLEPR